MSAQGLSGEAFTARGRESGRRAGQGMVRLASGALGHCAGSVLVPHIGSLMWRVGAGARGLAGRRFRAGQLVAGGVSPQRASIPDAFAPWALRVSLVSGGTAYAILPRAWLGAPCVAEQGLRPGRRVGTAPWSGNASIAGYPAIP